MRGDFGYVAPVVFEDFAELIDFIEPVAAEVVGGLAMSGLADGADVTDTKTGKIDAVLEEFAAEVAFGLEFAEFGGGAMQEAVGLGAGAVDGVLNLRLRFVLHRIGHVIFGRYAFGV